MFPAWSAHASRPTMDIDLLGRIELQGDEAVEAGVLGLVDDTHAAAELLDDSLMPNRLADRRAATSAKILDLHQIGLDPINLIPGHPSTIPGHSQRLGDAAYRFVHH